MIEPSLPLPEGCQIAELITPETRQQFFGAPSSYGQFYDEVFDEVGETIRHQGFAKKRDISALAAWKRLPMNTPWATALQEISEAILQETTSRLLRDGISTKSRISEFWESGLPGFSKGRFAVASTVLSAWNPREFGITDRRSRATLANLGCGCRDRLDSYSVYLAHLHALRDSLFPGTDNPLHTARQIDKILYSMAGNN